MNELLVVLIIIGTLGLIGTGVYFLFIRDARDTVLNANIQTAAEEMQSVLALRPSLANSIGDLETEMTGRTNFVWIGHTSAATDQWEFMANDDANTIRFQLILNETTSPARPVAHPTTGAAGDAPVVGWVANEQSAMRLHLRNTEDEWRCALIVLRPAGSLTDQQQAEMRGTWYDGGSSNAANGLHDCSPIGTLLASGTIDPAVSGCAFGTAASATDECVPASAQSWVIPDDTLGHLDGTSTDIENYRTLHRSPAALDGE